jgi:hypothetical protein
VHSGTEDAYTEDYLTVQISDRLLSIGTLFVTYDQALDGDHHGTTVYEVESEGYRSIDADEGAWPQVLDWITRFDGLLDQNSPEDLRLFVDDYSAPEFMSAPNEQ